jgi:DNA polymerase-3 subunit chi
MTDISLYHIQHSTIEKVLPKLLEKIVSANNRAILFCADESMMSELDKYLWSFSTKIFIPHGSKNDGYQDKQPIYITDVEENPNGASILVTLAEVSKDYLVRFSRMVYVFDNTKENLEYAKNIIKAYDNDTSHKLTCWQQDKTTGSWLKLESYAFIA